MFPPYRGRGAVDYDSHVKTLATILTNPQYVPAKSWASDIETYELEPPSEYKQSVPWKSDIDIGYLLSPEEEKPPVPKSKPVACLLYTSDAADE